MMLRLFSWAFMVCVSSVSALPFIHGIDFSKLRREKQSSFVCRYRAGSNCIEDAEFCHKFVPSTEKTCFNYIENDTPYSYSAVSAYNGNAYKIYTFQNHGCHEDSIANQGVPLIMAYDECAAENINGFVTEYKIFKAAKGRFKGGITSTLRMSTTWRERYDKLFDFYTSDLAFMYKTSTSIQYFYREVIVVDDTKINMLKPKGRRTLGGDEAGADGKSESNVISHNKSTSRLSANISSVSSRLIASDSKKEKKDRRESDKRAVKKGSDSTSASWGGGGSNINHGNHSSQSGTNSPLSAQELVKVESIKWMQSPSGAVQAVVRVFVEFSNKDPIQKSTIVMPTTTAKEVRFKILKLLEPESIDLYQVYAQNNEDKISVLCELDSPLLPIFRKNDNFFIYIRKPVQAD